MSAELAAMRRSRAYLSAVAEPPCPALAQLVREVGPCRAAELVFNRRTPSAVAFEVESRRERVSGRRLLDDIHQHGLRLLIPEDSDWPHERFHSLVAAAELGVAGMHEPIALWVRGDNSVADLLEQSVSIVGCRASSEYGEQVAAELAYGLGQAGLTVVSGAAYGIDSAAHRGALHADAPTVAWLACGADRDYPVGNRRLLNAIARTGAVISEYPPTSGARKHRFLVRNRLIAVAGQGTVVVEAAARSGAQNTASTTELLGQPIMAVPGGVGSRTSVGCHDLIRSGRAVLVTKASDVLEIVSPLGTVETSEAAQAPREHLDNLDSQARQVHHCLKSSQGLSAEELAIESGLPLRRVRALLPELELDGLATLSESGWMRA